MKAPGAPVFAVRISIPLRICARSKKSEGARDAGAPVDPQALLSRESKAIRIGRTASPLKPSASRARCLLGLLRETPGGLTFLSTAVGRCRTWRLASLYGLGLQGPGAAKLSQRDLTAWAARAGWDRRPPLISHSRATAPEPPD